MRARTAASGEGAPPAPSAARTARTRYWMAGVLFLCFIYFLPSWGPNGDWNQNIRLDMVFSLVNHGTIAIDGYQWNTGDDSYYGGHYYQINPPGQSLAGVPVFLAYKGLLSLAGQRTSADELGLQSHWKSQHLAFVLLQYAESIYTVALPTVAFLLLFFWFLGFLSSSLFNRTFLTVALGLATNVFAYAQVFYSHLPTAGLLFAGFAVAFSAGRDAPSTGLSGKLSRRPTLAATTTGLLLGLAVIFQYEAALISGLIGIYALTRFKPAHWPFLVLGAVPGLAIAAGYNWLAYHNPLPTAYSTHSFSRRDASGVGGLTWPPRPAALWGLTFSPYRGLFFLSPFLLLSVPGYALWARRGGREWLLFLAVPVTWLLLFSMFYEWYAGSAVGPRFLIPCLPFLAAPIVLVLDRVSRSPLRFVCFLLALVSACMVWAETLGGSGGYPAAGNVNPLLTYSLPALERGDLHLSLGTFLVGPLLGLHTPVTVLPLFVLLAGWSWRQLRRIYQLPPVAGAPRLNTDLEPADSGNA